MPLLILDDFGLNDPDQAQQSHLYELICARYETASTVITFNREFGEWMSIFENSPISGTAMDQLVHRAV